MVNGAVFVSLDAHDFRFEIGDALVELGHRHRIQVLPGEQRHRIIGAAREILVGIHGRSVDRKPRDVNKGAVRRGVSLA